MELALLRINQLASEAEPDRRQLMETLHKLAYSLETPNDTVHRYGHMNLQAATVKTGMDLGLFVCLTESDKPLAVDEISKRTGGDPELTNRILRYLAAIGAIDEATNGDFSANHVTRNLAERLVEVGLAHYFGTVAPQYQALPPFLKRTGYRNPTDELHTVFQDAWKTDLHAFAWFAHNPDHLAAFNDYMALRRKPDVSWLTTYPVAQEAGDWDPERPVFVNVGGGVGHQCAEFKNRFPGVPGRVILQDLPHSIAQALQTPGVENMVHDFFQTQPVQGAKFYHMRGVLHNHPPHKVQEVLRNTKSAMTSDSVLLVDEMVFPETGVNFDAASIDMTMLGAFASMERTEAQWHDTFGNAGLQLVRIFVYNPESYESIMEVRLR